MRVVLDTNVFVSSFFGEKPRKVIDLWAAGRITLCLSSPILEEYARVLRRMGAAESGGVRDLLRLFKEGRNVVFAARPPVLRIVPDDPDDDKFLACAVALDARFVVSGDRHLTALAAYADIRILTPAAFLGVIPSEALK
jgi:uncharacterized protein